MFYHCITLHLLRKKNVFPNFQKNNFDLFVESNHLKKYNVTVTPTRISEDFKRLKQHLLARFPNGTEPILVGPDFTQLQGKTLKYLRR